MCWITANKELFFPDAALFSSALPCLNYQNSGQKSCSKEQLQSLAWSRHFPLSRTHSSILCGLPVSSFSPQLNLSALPTVFMCYHSVHISVLTDGVNSPNRAEMRVENQVSVNPCFKVSLAQCLQVMLKGSFVGKFEIAGDHRAENCTANGPDRWDDGGTVRFGVQIKDVEIAQYSAPIFSSVFLLWWLWLMSPTRRSRIKKYTREKTWIIFLEG